MDDHDFHIIGLLQQQGRMSHSDLSARVGLSLPAIAERIRKLEAGGVIRGYTALVDAKLLGKGITAFISVLIDNPSCYAQFGAAVLSIPEVEECHHVVGEFDYLVKVKTRDTTSLEALISEHLRTIPGVGRTRTAIALSTLKESTVVELPPPEKSPGRKRHG
jgi:Lrp/AsnC family transcriptional regulator, leucine-responsive regulatory protein